MFEADERLMSCSPELALVLDKCINEPEFRWELVNEPKKVLDKFNVFGEEDVKRVKKMISDLNEFILDRLNNTNEKCIYRKRNNDLVYAEALNYKKRGGL